MRELKKETISEIRQSKGLENLKSEQVEVEIYKWKRQKRQPIQELRESELDEMWSFVRKRQIRAGYGTQLTDRTSNTFWQKERWSF